MIEFATALEVQAWCAQQRREGKRIGFVPTMGALHEGHLSLIRAAQAECDVVISSIFVNPTQFNDPTDFEKYPVTVEADRAMLESEHCDALFLPSVDEIYPQGKEYDLEVSLGYIGECLEAAHRQGHFEGVMQVVKRLLEITTPDVLFLGRKDYQQYLVIKRMVSTYKLPVEVVQCPIVREPDGLAMSSRNRRLSPAARASAVKLSASLAAITDTFPDLSPDHLTISYTDILNLDPLIDVEYLEIVDTETLQPVHQWEEATGALVCVAANVDGIRLIDNATIY